MTNEKRLQALAELQAEEHFADKQSEGERMEKFDLDKWAESYAEKKGNGIGDWFERKADYLAGANKALELVMEEAKKNEKMTGVIQKHDMISPVFTIEIKELKAIISKLRGEG